MLREQPNEVVESFICILNAQNELYKRKERENKSKSKFR